MFPLNGLEQALEVPGAKAVKVVPLDDLNEHRGAVHQRLGEQLQQVSMLVEVDEDVQALQGIEVLLELPLATVGLKSHAHSRVVRVRDGDEVEAAGAQVRDGGDDVASAQGDVLDAGAAVEVDVLLDLGAALARGGLVDGHLDDVVGRRHDDGVERRVLGGDLGVVDGPEPVEGEASLVVRAGCFHRAPVLVADAVVDGFEGDGGEEFLEGVDFVGGDGLEAGEEGAVVRPAGDQGVGGVSICRDDGGADRAIVVS